MSLTGVLLVAAHSLSAQAAAAGTKGDDETIVSAQKQRQTLAEVPLSETVIEAQTLADSGIRMMQDATLRVPNLYLSEFSSRRLSFPFVRGVGSGLNDPAVITYIDDVPQFGFGGTNLPLFAVDSVEFLRGPQGTLYGKNALGGLIHVHSQRPTETTELGAAAGFGSYDLQEFSGQYSGPLGGGLLGSAGVLDSQREGFTTNDFTGNRVDDRDGFFGRGRVLWNPDAHSEVDFSVFGERARDGGFVLSELSGLRDNPHHINQDFEGLADRDVLSPGLVYRNFGDGTDFTSVTSYENSKVDETSDFDFSPIDGVRRRSTENQDYVYQEFRLASNSAEKGPGSKGAGAHEPSWLVGASGFLSSAENSATNNFRPGGAGIFFPPANVGVDFTSGNFDDHGLAAFGQATFPLGADLALTGGVRYDYESKEVDRLHTFDPGSGAITLGEDKQSKDFDQFVPMASLAWQPSKTELVYLRAAKGFKAGGFNLTSPVGKEQFDPESAWTYELGWRQSFADERYTLGATAFHIDWKDMQLSLFDATAGGYIDNAGKSESQGLEFEGQARIVGGLDGFASLGVLDTEIKQFVDPFGNDTAGNDLPQAPDHTVGLGLQYTGEVAQDGRWFVRGEYQGVGDFFYDAGNIQGDSFDLVNFGGGIQLRNIGLSLWVRNAFDQDYVPIAFQPSPVDPNTFVGESGAPRVLGFTLSVNL